jgi:hypothetical protein
MLRFSRRTTEIETKPGEWYSTRKCPFNGIFIKGNSPFFSTAALNHRPASKEIRIYDLVIPKGMAGL